MQEIDSLNLGDIGDIISYQSQIDRIKKKRDEQRAAHDK